jgi:hypothetical protein
MEQVRKNVSVDDDIIIDYNVLPLISFELSDMYCVLFNGDELTVENAIKVTAGCVIFSMAPVMISAKIRLFEDL